MRDFSKIAWQDFYLSDFFKFEKGNQNNMASLTSGDIPLVSARKVDNGFKDFVAPNNKKLFDGGIITLNIDGDGGAGIAYYQPYKMALDSHVAALIPKIDLNRYQLIFIAACITKQRNRFGHGYSINSNRLRSFKLMLPIIEGGEIPDWEFMNDFQKAKEQEILKPTIDILCKRLIINEIIGGGKSLGSNWKDFIFGDVFTIQSTKSGIDKIKLVPGEGETPYITRTDANNGIDSFITEQSTKYRIDEGNVITIGLDTQTVFYQSKPFYTGQNIQVIKHPKLDKFNALFLIVAIKQLVKKFSWGSYGATLTRLRKSRIYLPTNQDGEIDFEFMSTFMQNVEQDILKTTLPIFKAKLNGCKSTVSGG